MQVQLETIEKLNSDDWEQTLKTNVISHFYFTKLAIPMLKNNKGGSIINISSTAGIMGFAYDLLMLQANGQS